jgi:hypothetical protein
MLNHGILNNKNARTSRTNGKSCPGITEQFRQDPAMADWEWVNLESCTYEFSDPIKVRICALSSASTSTRFGYFKIYRPSGHLLSNLNKVKR